MTEAGIDGRENACWTPRLLGPVAAGLPRGCMITLSANGTGRLFIRASGCVKGMEELDASSNGLGSDVLRPGGRGGG
jgi:hypothetical protein